MPRYKSVNGEQIALSADEEAARAAEEAYDTHPDRATERVARAEDKAMRRVEIKGVDRAQFSALLDHENRIRALENRQAVTRAQLIAWLRARL